MPSLSLRELRPSAREMWKGARAGLGFGLAYACIGALIYGIEGSRPFEHNGIAFPAAITLYIFGCTLAGLIVGVFHKLTVRFPLLAYIVGVVAAAPFSFVTTAVMEHRLSGWLPADWFTAVLGSVIFGIMGVRIFHKDPVALE